jgi:hypothetical protein
MGAVSAAASGQTPNRERVEDQVGGPPPETPTRPP